jgi:hypothetical protein
VAATLPTPTTLYIYNDLPYFPPPSSAERWQAILGDLVRVLRAQPHVRFLEVAALVESLAASGAAGPYTRALAIGGSGRRVAELLQARTGWFGAISTVPLSRHERADGSYAIVVAGGDTESELAKAAGRVAIVDDTLYSGLTVRWLLARLPAYALPEVLCLQAVQSALLELSAQCPVFAGVQLPGERETDLSVIKASHLFEPGAIRGEGGDLAFYERRVWLDAWFPDSAEEIAALCAHLRALLPVAVDEHGPAGSTRIDG